jgi:hypothetical protein
MIDVRIGHSLACEEDQKLSIAMQFGPKTMLFGGDSTNVAGVRLVSTTLEPESNPSLSQVQAGRALNGIGTYRAADVMCRLITTKDRPGEVGVMWHGDFGATRDQWSFVQLGKFGTLEIVARYVENC